MPFYEYECSSCGQQTEILQKVSDAPARKCPGCGRSALKRLISAPVFRLKGSGWYETDFKSDQDRKRNLAGGEDSGDSDSKSDTKADDKDTKAADAKPAEKTAEKPAGSGSESKKEAVKPVAKAPAKSKAKPAARKKSAKR